MARWRAAPSLGLAFQQAIAPGRGVERPLLGENSGPMLRQDLEKMVDDAPVLRQSLRNQIGDLREARPLGRDPVEKPGEARRERRRLSGEERRLARPARPTQAARGRRPTPAARA